MKKIFASAVSVLAIGAALSFASAASAADLDINLQGASVSQMSGPITQRALSVAVAVGEVGNNSSVDSMAADLGQNASIDLLVDQGAGGFVNGNLLSTTVGQVVQSVDQAAASLAGSGDVGNGSTVKSLAATIGQGAAVNVRVRQ